MDPLQYGMWYARQARVLRPAGLLCIARNYSPNTANNRCMLCEELLELNRRERADSISSHWLGVRGAWVEAVCVRSFKPIAVAGGLTIAIIIAAEATSCSTLVVASRWALGVTMLAVGPLFSLTVRVRPMHASMRRPAAWMFIASTFVHGALAVWRASGLATEVAARVVIEHLGVTFILWLLPMSDALPQGTTDNLSLWHIQLRPI